MLSSGSTEIWFQPELPGLYILHQEMLIFGIFSNFLSNIHQPHLVARQIVTFCVWLSISFIIYSFPTNIPDLPWQSSAHPEPMQINISYLITCINWIRY